MAKQTIEALVEQIEDALPDDVHEKDVRLTNGAVLRVVRLKLPDE
jgi:hypothetical protein